jgi:hypothetical protein
MKKLEELPKKYPELFQNDHYNSKRSKDEEPSYYFECGEGWSNLLDNLLAYIKHSLGRYREVVEIRQRFLDKGEEPLPWVAKYFEKNPVDPLDHFSIDQIKEKFGGLRFYISFGEASGEAVDRCDGAISLAEMLSFHTCETCGQFGSRMSPAAHSLVEEYKKTLSKDEGYLLGGGYIQTLCEKHQLEKAQGVIERHKEYRAKS